MATDEQDDTLDCCFKIIEQQRVSCLMRDRITDDHVSKQMGRGISCTVFTYSVTVDTADTGWLSASPHVYRYTSTSPL